MTGGAHFNEVFFEDVRVPAANLVGDLHDGWRVARTTLMNERMSAGTSISCGEAFQTLAAVRARPGVDDPLVRQALARVYARAGCSTSRPRGCAARSSRARSRARRRRSSSWRPRTSSPSSPTSAPASSVPAARSSATTRPSGGRWADAVLERLRHAHRRRHRRDPAQHHRRDRARPAPRAPTSDVVALTQQLIRNACVNDGHAESGQEVRNADVLRTYLEGAGLDVETFESAPGRSNLVVRIEGSDPEAPVAVPPRPHRRRARQRVALEPRPVRRRDRRRRPVGPGRHRHVQPHRVDGRRGARARRRRLPAARARSSTPRWPTRRPAAPTAPSTSLSSEADAVRCDYLITESGGFPLATPNGVRLPYLARGEGPAVGAAARDRHAGARVDAVRHRQRPAEGGRDRAPARRVPAADPARRRVEGVRQRARHPRGDGRAAAPGGRASSRRSPSCRRASPRWRTPARTRRSRRRCSRAGARRTSSRRRRRSPSTSGCSPATTSRRCGR